MARSRFQPKTGIVPTVQKVAPTTSRRTRYPKHSWHIKFRPYQLQPMCIAPVSAGDTVKQLRFEGRVLTDGVLDQIAGWWSEMYWFYVRFSALDEYASAQRMAVTPGDNLAGLITASNTWTMHNGKGPDWLFMCMKPIIYNYFRPQSGAYNDYALDSVPAAGVVGQSWLDAISLETDLPSPSATDDYTGHWTHYEALRKARLVTMDYPEYLASQGVAVPEQLLQPLAEKRRPELLRYTRQFSYPANTVKEDGTGTVAAVSWVTAERMDRSIYCDEPGFIVGCLWYARRCIGVDRSLAAFRCYAMLGRSRRLCLRMRLKSRYGRSPEPVRDPLRKITRLITGSIPKVCMSWETSFSMRPRGPA